MGNGTGDPGVRILMIDNRTVMREALTLLVQQDPDMHVVAHASAMNEALELDVTPEVVLTEYGLPDAEGALLVRRLADRYPTSGILVLSAVTSRAKVEEVIAAGALGYLTETADTDEFRAGIRKVARGENYLQPDIGIKLFQEPEPARPDSDPPRHPLSAKELDVLRYLALGYTNHEIADRMEISLRTVESHRARILQKLGLKYRWELVQYAHEIGLFGSSSLAADEE